jgi:hypothetical protein
MRIGRVTKTLINATTYNNNNNIDITDALYGIQWVTPPIFNVVATEVNDGATVTISIQTSHDAGSTYNNVCATAGMTATTTSLLNCNNAPWAEKARVNIAYNTGNLNWTVTVKASGMAFGGRGL